MNADGAYALPKMNYKFIVNEVRASVALKRSMTGYLDCKHSHNADRNAEEDELCKVAWPWF